MIEKSTLEGLMYSTIRIETVDAQGNVYTGTGFQMAFTLGPNLKSNVLITNRHVMHGMVEMHITFCLQDAQGNALDDHHYNLILDIAPGGVVYHPDPTVDLCAIPMAGVHDLMASQGAYAAIVVLDDSMIATPEYLKELNAVETVTMIGYPNGLWDKANNKPIFRRGTTATHPGLNYCGKNDFLIDCACYPGSSGSPVMLVDQDYIDKKGAHRGGRAILLGVLYAGPQYSVNGEVTVVDIPTVKVANVGSKLMLNLGIVIKAEEIHELKQAVPAFFSFTTGNTAGEQSLDIPQYILRSGKQTIQIKAYPKAKEPGILETAITSQAVFTLRIVHFDYDKRPMNSTQIASIQMPHRPRPVSIYEWSGEFEAKVPYNLKGWSAGQDLSKEEPLALEKEVLAATQRYRNALEKKDVSTIANMIYEREKEVAQATYLFSGEPGSYDHGWDKLEQEAKELVELRPIDGYDMRLFADNKVVALVKTEGKFRDFPVVYGRRANHKLRFYAIYFYRPQAGSPLKIIR